MKPSPNLLQRIRDMKNEKDMTEVAGILIDRVCEENTAKFRLHCAKVHGEAWKKEFKEKRCTRQ